MDQESRVIGRLEEFKVHTDRRLDRIEQKLDSHARFRWTLTGSISVIVFMIGKALESIWGH